MFDYFNRKKKKKKEKALAEAEAELRAKLAKKMERWTPEQLMGDATDYTIIDGKKVKLDKRIDLGNTIQPDSDTTIPELTLEDTTDYKFDPRLNRPDDPWEVSNLCDTGKWKKNERK